MLKQFILTAACFVVVACPSNNPALPEATVDTHSHADNLIFAHPDAPVVSQGITTVIVGQDGDSVTEARPGRYLSRNP